MFKFFMLIVFLFPTVLNYRLKRENSISIKKSAIGIFATILLFVVGSFFCYKFDNTALGYIIALATATMLYTSLFYQGIAENGIHIFLGTSPLLKQVEPGKITKIDIVKNKNDDIELKIHAFGDTYKQVYRLADEGKIIHLIEKQNVVFSKN